MLFDATEARVGALDMIKNEHNRSRRAFQDRLARRALRAEQKSAADAYRLEDEDRAAAASQAEAAKQRRARARSEGAAKARRRARARARRTEERRTQSQGDGGGGEARRKKAETEALTSEERVAMASWEVQARAIESEQQLLAERMKKRSDEVSRRRDRAAAAPTRVAKPELFRLDLPVPDAEDLVEPEEQTNSDWHLETAKARMDLMKGARPKKAALPLAEVLENEIKRAPIRDDLLAGGGDAKPPRQPRKKKHPQSILGGFDDEPAAKPMIRLPKLACAEQPDPKEPLPFL